LFREQKVSEEVFMEQRKTRSRMEWLDIVGQQEESGLSARAFCQARAVGLASFYQWRRRLRDEVPVAAGKTDAASGNNGAGKTKSAGGIEPSEPSGETESPGVFIDMGQVASSGVEPATGGGRWVVTLDLGEGLKLTLRRD